jgi:predicted HAD superfamily phosphohydrolase YqeG
MSWQRVIYTLQQAWQRRRALSALAADPQRHCRHVTHITAAFLARKGITGLVLDFDGVLAPHGDLVPLPQVVTWLQQLTQDFAQERIFILSNKPMPARQTWFAQHFPHIHFIGGVRKKPYPDGLQYIVAQSNIPAEKIVLVDDRLLTGMLATLIAQTQGLWITQAYCRLSIKNLRELFFFMLRSVEKWVF